jgi:hypothetical protein
MYLLRTLSIRDVGNALVRREFGLAFRISQNLGGNAVNSVRFRLYKRTRLPIRHATRRAS